MELICINFTQNLMVKIRIQLHKSMRIPNQPYSFEGDFENITLIEAINKLLKDNIEIYKLCLKDGYKKPGLLYFSNDVELSSLGLLETNIDEDIEIRIVPILHGG